MKRLLILTAAILILLCQNVSTQEVIEPEVIWEKDTPFLLKEVKFSPDDKYFFARWGNDGLYKFDTETGELLGKVIDQSINHYEIVSEHGFIICEGYSYITVYDYNTYELLHTFDAHEQLSNMDISADESKIVFGQATNFQNPIENYLYVYSLPDFELITKFRHDVGSPDYYGFGAIKFLPNNEEILIVPSFYFEQDEWYIEVFSVPENKIVRKFGNPGALKFEDDYIEEMYISPDEKYIIIDQRFKFSVFDLQEEILFKSLDVISLYQVEYNQTGDFIFIGEEANEPNRTFYTSECDLRFMIHSDEIGEFYFLNNDNTKMLGTGFKLKMYHLNLDSLATNVSESEELETIYPNPSQDFVIINTEIGTAPQISIFDYAGNEYTVDFTIEPSGLRLNISHFPDGMYMVKVISDKNQKSFKLIKGWK